MPRRCAGGLSLAVSLALATYAQGPTGIIVGTVADQSDVVVPNASVTVTNKSTGIARTINANSEGLFSAPALQSGEYEVRVEMQGFRTVVRDATVQAGETTTVNF